MELKLYIQSIGRNGWKKIGNKNVFTTDPVAIRPLLAILNLDSDSIRVRVGQRFTLSSLESRL